MDYKLHMLFLFAVRSFELREPCIAEVNVQEFEHDAIGFRHKMSQLGHSFHYVSF